MKHGGAIGEGTPHERAAVDMLAAFGSVGAVSFDVTWTDQDGNKTLFRKGQSITGLLRSMPAMLNQAVANRRNLIVRPYGPPAVFLQLDDLDVARLEQVRPFAFLTLNTSPGSHQAWLALADTPLDDFATRLRKGAGADATASGATRVAGSLNFKDKYAPSFPRVTIGKADHGRVATPDELAEAGLVAALEQRQPYVASRARYIRDRKWPDYQRCLDGAPANTLGNGPDISRADYVFAMTAASWGWGVEDIAARLMESSDKAKRNGKNYAQTTAQNGAAAAARNTSVVKPRP